LGLAPPRPRRGCRPIRSRRPCFVANWGSLPQKWPPPPRNLAHSSERTATTKQMELSISRGRSGFRGWGWHRLVLETGVWFSPNVLGGIEGRTARQRHHLPCSQIFTVETDLYCDSRTPADHTRFLLEVSPNLLGGIEGRTARQSHHLPRPNHLRPRKSDSDPTCTEQLQGRKWFGRCGRIAGRGDSGGGVAECRGGVQGVA